MQNIKHFLTFLTATLPAERDRKLVQMFFGSFLCLSRHPGFLVLCGNGVGAWGLVNIIHQMLGRNSVSEVSMSDITYHPDRCDMATGCQCNILHDMTCIDAYRAFSPTIRRVCGEFSLVPGMDQPAPRQVVLSRFIPDPDDLPPEVAEFAVIVRFSVFEKLGFDFPKILGEMNAIRGWAREGLKMLDEAGGFYQDRVKEAA